MSGGGPGDVSARKARAVFLDRDGTLIKEKGYLHDPAELELEEGAAEAVRRLNHAGWPVVLVTNQSGIARGLFDERAMDRVHDALREMLAREGAHLDGVYACPHHPEARVAALRGACACRKPGIGLLRQAERDLGVQPGGSTLIGDKGSDMQCARNGGLVGILVTTGYGWAEWGKALRQGSAWEPDRVAGSLLEAVERVLSEGAPDAAGAPPRGNPPWTCKFVSLEHLKARLRERRERGETVVLASGVFDLFHAGHAGYLQAARREGDVLVVGVNDDASSRALKGPSRPVYPAEERIQVLSALGCVDECVLVRETTADALVEALRPDVHAKGTDYAPDGVPEKATVERVGGRVRIVGPPRVRSSSETLRTLSGERGG